MNGYVWAAAACLGCMAAAMLAKERKNLLLAVMGDGDEDMKIATPGSFNTKPVEDASELAAKKFLELKRSGNIEKARALGERYAAVLLEKEAAIREGFGECENSLCLHQQLVLYSYVVSRVIADLSPDSILAQTSLNVFYDKLEEISPDLHKHVSDMAAFSLYILCERSSRSVDAIGKVYARLCGNEDVKAAEEEGNTLYQKFYDVCAAELEEAGYSAV